jgi:hypothetical protein
VLAVARIVEADVLTDVDIVGGAEVLGDCVAAEETVPLLVVDEPGVL